MAFASASMEFSESHEHGAGATAGGPVAPIPMPIAGASLEDGSVVISLAVPMRLLPPRSFHAPARAPMRHQALPTADSVTKALFDRIKTKTR